jgi:hypothetical protein
MHNLYPFDQGICLLAQPTFLTSLFTNALNLIDPLQFLIWIPVNCVYLFYLLLHKLDSHLILFTLFSSLRSFTPLQLKVNHDHGRHFSTINSEPPFQ